jgi:hypothetical protein
MTRLRRSDGWAMPAAMVLMAAMLTLALGIVAYADKQTQESARERLNESGFNLVEGALTQQLAILSRSWPAALGSAYPASCGPGSTDARCPDPGAVKESFNSVDYRYAAGTTWVTTVRDNTTVGGVPSDFYSTATVSANTYDANGDGKLWVRAEAMVKGRKRALVGLAQAETVTEQVSHSAILAGSFATSNNGNKPIVCTKLPDDPNGNNCNSSSTLTGPVQLRCADLLSILCLDARIPVQIQPYVVLSGYTGGAAMSGQALQRLRARAVADGTYYASGCPSNPSGAVVFIESGNCSWNNSAGACCNSPAAPGMLIVNNGTVSFGGNIVFSGIVYAANAQNSILTVVSTGGTSGIRGGVLIDGMGKLTAGSSKLNVIFDDFAFGAVRSYGAARFIQNKWREVAPSA